MAVLNIRLDDIYRDQLREKAAERDVSLSEYVRALVLEDVVDVRQPERETDTEPAPETMPLTQRRMLALLHRINARVMPEEGETLDGADGDRDNQLEQALILEKGFTAEYGAATSRFRTELSPLNCTRVMDILEMFGTVSYSIDRLVERGEPLDQEMSRGLQFRGFDFNDALEGHMASYVEFLTKDETRWTELQSQIAATDRGNSHMRMLDRYLRMLAEFRNIMDSRGRVFSPESYFLTMAELQRIYAARTHPSRR